MRCDSFDHFAAITIMRSFVLDKIGEWGATSRVLIGLRRRPLRPNRGHSALSFFARVLSHESKPLDRP